MLITDNRYDAIVAELFTIIYMADPKKDTTFKGARTEWLTAKLLTLGLIEPAAEFAPQERYRLSDKGKQLIQHIHVTTALVLGEAIFLPQRDDVIQYDPLPNGDIPDFQHPATYCPQPVGLQVTGPSDLHSSPVRGYHPLQALLDPHQIAGQEANQ